MESDTLQTQWPITHTNKEGVQEPRPNNDQEIIAKATTGTMAKISIDTKLGTDGTPKIVYYTQNTTRDINQLQWHLETLN